MPKGIYQHKKLSDKHKRRISEGLLGRKHTEETKRKISEANKGKMPWIAGKHHSEKAKRKIGEANKRRIITEETKRKLSKANKGKISPMFGKHHSEETKKRMSKNSTHYYLGKTFSEEHKRKIGESNKNRILSEQTKKKISESHKGKKISEEHKSRIRMKMKIIAKERWQNPDYVRKQMKAKGVRPNKTEIEFGELINQVFPNEYKYVGDGEVIIAGKCPDFININGQKKIIELFGDYWHRGQDPQDRINLFKKYGWDTLVVWERELKNPEIVKKDILDFNNI